MSDIEHLARQYMHTEDVQFRSAEPPKTPWKKRFAAIVFGFAMAFILGEIALRLLGYNAAEQKKDTDVRTGLRVYRPNASVLYREECLVNTINTNSLGFHSVEYAIPKPAGTKRIVVIGDSFVEAAQVPVDKMFTSLLQDKLNSRGGRYEVIPIGISGNASYANLQYLKAYGLQFKPDLVINAFFSNDVLADYYRPDNPAAAAPHDEKMNLIPAPTAVDAGWTATIKNRLKSLAKKSNIIVLVYSKYLDFQLSRNAREEVPSPEAEVKKLSIDSEVYLANVPDFWQKAWKLQESIFKEFKNISRGVGADFLLVALPEAQRTHPDIGKDFLATVPAGVKIDLDMPDRQLKKIADRNRIKFFAAQSFFTSRASADRSAKTYWPCDGHFNETGHEWMADALYDFLIRNNLI